MYLSIKKINSKTYKTLLFLFCLSCSHVFAEAIPAKIGAPFYTPDVIQGRLEGNSLDELVAKAVSIALSPEALAKYGIQPSECGYNVYPKNRDNMVAEVVFNGRCGGGARIFGTWICPGGKVSAVSVCEVSYGLGLTPDNAGPSCPVGNPIDVATGGKIQREVDIPSKGIGQVSFERFYNAVGFAQKWWKHNYDRRLKAVDPYFTESIRQKSSNYSSRNDACVNGWSEIKSRIQDPWSVGSTAIYKNGTCQISRNGAVVKVLPLIPDYVIDRYFHPGSVQLQRPDGSTIEYQYYDSSQLTALTGDHGTLSLIESPNLVWHYSTPDGDVEEYSDLGVLTSINSRNGVKQSLTYDSSSGLLTQVQDSVGQKLFFNYVNDVLASVTTGDNKITSYLYSATGLLSQVTHSDSTQRKYHYEDARFTKYLTGITDERGVRYATWSYDAQGRAISSEHAGGAEKTSLSFNIDGSTTVTNALGKNTIYRFVDSAGSRRVSSVEGQPTANCVGANQNYTYTDEGWLASKTDWNGVKTTYQYNAKGQETSRTEAYGTPVAKTITTEWHPTLNLKTKVTEPGVETTYNYDANGLLLSQKTRSIAQ